MNTEIDIQKTAGGYHILFSWMSHYGFSISQKENDLDTIEEVSEWIKKIQLEYENIVESANEANQ
jgi:hypothetical protein